MKLVALVMASLPAWVACGATATPTIKPPPPANRTVATATHFTPAQLCARVSALKQERCGDFARIEMDGCEKLVKDNLDDPSNRPAVEAIAECALDLTACGDVLACRAGMESSAQLRACRDKSDTTIGAAVGVPHAAWKQQVKRGVVKYSQIKSTKALPVEVCGIPTENTWLGALTCDDGSHPITGETAETVRVGSLGEGGRCNSIIDLYRVTCPEASYDIYLDGYVCPQP